VSAYEKVTKTIDGVQYDVTLLGAKVASKVLLKLMKSIAPVFMTAAAWRGAMDVGKVSDAIRGLSEDDFDWIVARFAERTDVHLGDRSPNLGSENGAVFDMHFSGKSMQMFEWLEFAIEANFAPFMRELKSRFALAAPTPAPSASPSPSTSTGG
jgi:hypothetical protein